MPPFMPAGVDIEASLPLRQCFYQENFELQVSLDRNQSGLYYVEVICTNHSEPEPLQPTTFEDLAIAHSYYVYKCKELKRFGWVGRGRWIVQSTQALQDLEASHGISLETKKQPDMNSARQKASLLARLTPALIQVLGPIEKEAIQHSLIIPANGIDTLSRYYIPELEGSFQAKALRVCFLFYRAWFLSELNKRNILPANLGSTIPKEIDRLLTEAISLSNAKTNKNRLLKALVSGPKLPLSEISKLISKIEEEAEEAKREARRINGVTKDGDLRTRAKLVRKID